MKTIILLASTCVLGSLIHCAAASPDSGPTLSSTNIVRESASGPILTPTPIPVPRLSLELPPAKPVSDAGPIPILRNDFNIPRSEQVTRHPFDIESAERVNVNSMREYRQGWEKLRIAPGSSSPVLYPSRIHRSFEANQ